MESGFVLPVPVLQLHQNPFTLGDWEALETRDAS